MPGHGKHSKVLSGYEANTVSGHEEGVCFMNLNHDLVRNRCKEITDSLDRLEKIGQTLKENFL